jgi:dynein heavy chain
LGAHTRGKKGGVRTHVKFPAAVAGVSEDQAVVYVNVSPTMVDVRVSWVESRALLLGVHEEALSRCFKSASAAAAIASWFENETSQPALFVSVLPDATSSVSVAQKSGSDSEAPPSHEVVVTMGEKHVRAVNAMYFTKSETRAITSDFGEDEISHLVDYGTLGENELDDLKLLLNELYMPVFGPEAEEPVNTFSTKRAEQQLQQSPLANFSGAMKAFSNDINHAMDKVYMGHHIHVPDIVHPCLADPTLIQSPDSIPYSVTVQLEMELKQWTEYISATVEREEIRLQEAPTTITDPLDEISFWRRRLHSLSTLYEQIRMPDIQRLLEAMDRLHLTQLTEFRDHAAELDRAYTEAQDNAKFLTTLERHFKVLNNAELEFIIDTMPSMMNAIRMVWIISRHYNTDERMVPLLLRIANKICDRVSAAVAVDTILDMPKDEAATLCAQGTEVLLSWVRNYNKTQEKIDHSSSEHRWQFDKKRHFDQSKHIVRIIADLSEVVTVRNNYKNFLGPRLTSVTGDPTSIGMLKDILEATTEPLRTVSFDIFSPKNTAQWDLLMNDFRTSMVTVQSRTSIFLDGAFHELRSAEDAFDMLCGMGIKSDVPPTPPVLDDQRVGNGTSIASQMMSKFDDILRQYAKELVHAERTFDTLRDCPPLYRNFPPVAGAIAWAAQIFQRVKQPIVRFRTMSGLLESPLGDQIKNQYLTLVRRLDTYIRDLYQNWCTITVSACSGLLKQPVFGPIPIGGIHQKADVPPPPYVVNFSPQICTLIREASHLDKLGMRIPYMAQNMALQEDTYDELRRQLTHVISCHNTLLQSLVPIESEALASHLTELEKKISEGCWPLNWTSLHIRTFINRSLTALRVFRSVLINVRKSSAIIEQCIYDIESSVLFDVSIFKAKLDALAGYPPSTEVGGPSSIAFKRSNLESPTHAEQVDAATIGIAEFVYIIDHHREEVQTTMTTRYRSIRDPLHKVEQIVAETDTGCSPLLKMYYSYWENRVFEAIEKMILTTLNVLCELLQSPLIRIWGSLAESGPSIVMQPTIPDVRKMLRKMIVHILHASDAFPRWMRGSCRPCVPIPQGDNKPPLKFTFYDAVCNSPVIIRAVQRVEKLVAEACAGVEEHAEAWTLYNEQHNLWTKRGKRSMEEQREILLRQTPTLDWFREKITFYDRLARAVCTEATDHEVGFVRFDVSKLAADLEKQVHKWRKCYGDVLYTVAHEEFVQLIELFSDYDVQLELEPTELTELKRVLKSVSIILGNEQSIQLQIYALEGKYDLLEHYELLPSVSLEGNTSEYVDVKRLKSNWREIILNAKTKDLKLTAIKEHFKGDTEKQTQAFSDKCTKTLEKYDERGPTRPQGEMKKGLEAFNDFKAQYVHLVEEKEKIIEVRKLFGLEIMQVVDLMQVGENLDTVSPIYETYQHHIDFEKKMSGMLWDSLDESILKRGALATQTEWRKLPKSAKNIKVPYDLLGAEIQSFINSIPLIESLKNEAMQTRHWNQLMSVTKVKFTFSDTFTLASIFKMNLARFEDDINSIVGVAMQEMKIDRELNKIVDMWSNTNFQHTLYQREQGKPMAGPKIFTLSKTGDGGTDELRLELDDHLLKLNAMASKQAALNFVDKIKYWTHTLDLMVMCIDEWMKVQQNWVLMDKIFGASEDIRMQLPEEARQFDAINQAWVKIMMGMHEEPNAKIQCEVDGRLAVLESIMERLESCQKSLSNYLNTKRAAFPRFYFKSEAALLSILGDSNPLNIQEHLSSMFMACKKFKFVQGSQYIAGMVSPKKEQYAYRKHVSTEGAVETWLTKAEQEMKSTLRLIAKGGIFAYAGADRMNWLNDQLCMVAILASQIWWTWEVEDVFKLVRQGDKYAMKTLLDRWSGHLDGLIEYVRRPDATKMMKRKIMQLMIIEVHSRDLIGVFVRDSVLTETDFMWESQLRMYWDRVVDDVAIKQCTGVFEYGYEYTGLLNRLVITPLTDRCYMTITQALTFRLGCSPAGPAGTGKTETTKDLAKGLGLPCYVTCCGEGLDYYQMGQIFSGLCQIGAWGCFDEFNRINIEVLSVVSAQIKSIQDALNVGASMVDLRGTSDVQLDAKVGIFITMNPGYAGRNELPDNLKALFRPVMMIVPDSEKICLIMLMAQGFKNAKVLARKMTVLYKLASEQLSKQYHYDFALRALISVLLNAGGALGAAIKANPEYEPEEDLVMMRSLRDTNKPKFVYEDVPLFRNLIIDLFPGLDCPRIAFEKLQVAVDNWFTENTYKHSDNDGEESGYMKQVDKTVQVFETIDTRWATMIVGPTGGGKTTVMKCLQHAMYEAFGYTVKQFVLNPKAQKTSLLYGKMDNETGEWTNGILANTFRMMNQPLPESKKMHKHWIVYDGDVDAVWIEDMNSVMDDNKCLTLSNGERIQLMDHSVMLFETFDLQYASPATISRCGMVWVDPKDLRYRPFYERWVKLRAYEPVREVEREMLMTYFERYIPKTLELIVEGFVDGVFVGRLSQIIPVTDLSMVRQLTALLDALVPAETGDVPLSDEELEGLFIYATIWALGGPLATESRQKLSEFIESISQARLPPSDKSLFDYIYDPVTHAWETWESKVPAYAAPSPFEFSKILVPTKDNVTYLTMLDLLVRDTYSRPTMFVGMPGCAKSVTVKNFMDFHLDSENFNTLSINFSSQTSAVDVRSTFRTAVDKRTGRTYGPKSGKKIESIRR